MGDAAPGRTDPIEPRRDHPLVDRGAVEDPGDINPWPELIGACHTTDTLAAFLGVSPERIEVDANQLRLLRLISSDGVGLFPVFQFDGRQVVKGLGDVLEVLREGVDSPPTWAGWLTGRAPTGPSDARPTRRIDRLKGGAIEEVMREARNAAWAWKS